MPRLYRFYRLLLALPGLVSAADRSTPESAANKPGKEYKDCAACPTMVIIPGGTYTMGSPEDEPGRDPDGGPAHEVAVAPFALGKFEGVPEFQRAANRDYVSTDLRVNTAGLRIARSAGSARRVR